MIVAVTRVRVVKVAFDDVVGVIAVGDRVVPAIGAVDVILRVARAGRRMGIYVHCGGLDLYPTPSYASKNEPRPAKKHIVVPG